MLTKKITDGYKMVENAVVGSYKKIETGAVNGFTRLTDKCVQTLFAREGETVEEARKRLASHSDI